MNLYCESRRHLLSLFMVALAPAALAQPCDPTTINTPASVPKGRRLVDTCGNGRIDLYVASCTRRVFEGCGMKRNISMACEEAQEACDGRALPFRESCESLGYPGGALRCNRTCTAVDESTCSLCEPGVPCREESLPPTAFGVTVVVSQNVPRLFWATATQPGRGPFAGFSAPIGLDGRLGPSSGFGTFDPPLAFRGGWAQVSRDGRTLVGLRLDGGSFETALGDPDGAFLQTMATLDEQVVVAPNPPERGPLQWFNEAGRVTTPPPGLTWVHGPDVRFVVLPTASGALRVQAEPMALEVRPGDRLLVWMRTSPAQVSPDVWVGGLGLVREDVIVPRETLRLSAPSLRVTLGSTEVAFEQTRDTVGPATFVHQRALPVPLRATRARSWDTSTSHCFMVFGHTQSDGRARLALSVQPLPLR
jgi:hypothetical protein